MKYYWALLLLISAALVAEVANYYGTVNSQTEKLPSALGDSVGNSYGDKKFGDKLKGAVDDTLDKALSCYTVTGNVYRTIAAAVVSAQVKRSDLACKAEWSEEKKEADLLNFVPRACRLRDQ